MSRWTGRLPRGPVSRRGRWRRSRVARVLSATLVGVSAWLVASAVLPRAPDPGVPTVVAARDVALGTTLTAEDVRVEGRPAGQRPDGALPDAAGAVGQVAAAPVGSGEIVTAARFRGPAQLAGMPPGRLAVSVPVADASLLSTLRPADLVSVLVVGSGQTVATAASVLSTTTPPSGVLGSSTGSGGHVVLALTAEEARAVATAMGAGGVTSGFLLALRGEPPS